MGLEYILIASIVSVLSVLVTGIRTVGLATMVKYSLAIDILFSAGLFYLFYGTLTGAVVAMSSGLLMAISLTALKAMHEAKIGFSFDPIASRLPKMPKATHNPNWMYNDDVYTRGMNVPKAIRGRDRYKAPVLVLQ